MSNRWIMIMAAVGALLLGFVFGVTHNTEGATKARQETDRCIKQQHLLIEKLKLCKSS